MRMRVRRAPGLACGYPRGLSTDPVENLEVFHKIPWLSACASHALMINSNTTTNNTNTNTNNNSNSNRNINTNTTNNNTTTTTNNNSNRNINRNSVKKCFVATKKFFMFLAARKQH